MTKRNPMGKNQPSRGGNEPAPQGNERDESGHRENRDNSGNRVLESD